MAKDSTLKRAIGYARVSTDKQADRGVSLDAQREKLAAYATLYELELVAVEVDAGESAKSLARPGLQRALAALHRGEAEALVVVKLDRLTRSVKDLAELLERSRREGWQLVSVSEHLDTGTAAGRLVLNVLMAVAQWEREAVGERTAAALAHKRARGEYTGGRVPFGYRLAPDGVALVEDPNEQEVIALARELRRRGWSLRRIGRELEARGLMPRSGQWHPQKVKGLVAHG